jgi:hypothetical protein
VPLGKGSVAGMIAGLWLEGLKALVWFSRLASEIFHATTHYLPKWQDKNNPNLSCRTHVASHKVFFHQMVSPASPADADAASARSTNPTATAFIPLFHDISRFVEVVSLTSATIAL